MSPGGPPGGPRPPYGPPQPRFQGPPVGAVPVGTIGGRPPYVGSPQGPLGPGPMMGGGPPSVGSPQGMPRPQMVNLPHRQNQGNFLKSYEKICVKYTFKSVTYLIDIVFLRARKVLFSGPVS
jgi:hypothetical protein